MIKAGGMTPKTIANARIQVMPRARGNLLLSLLFELMQNQRTPAKVRKFAAGSRWSSFVLSWR